MIFGKKKPMVDVRELQRRGVVRIPKDDVVIPTDKQGFVDFSSDNSSVKSSSGLSSSGSYLGFMSKSKPVVPSSVPSFSSEVDGYSKREVDTKMTELDNKIYKLEQRVELLERKAGVGSSSNSNSLIGW